MSDEEPITEREEFYGKYVYDNIHQYNIEEIYPRLVAKIVEEERKGNYLIDDPELIGEITYFLTYMLELADKYDAAKEISSIVVDTKTNESFTLESFAKYVDSHSVISTAKAKKVISELGRRYAVIMAKKAAMRKGKAEHVPFLFRVAQKLQFTKWTPEEEDYLNEHIHNALHQAMFLINHYRVIEDGELHMLMSGDNKSGKTATSIRLLLYSWRDLNGFFRPYIEEQIAEGKYLRLDGTEYTKFEELVPPKFKLRDHIIFMDRKGRLNILATSPFPDLLYDEGNFTNINLKSMDPESVDEIIAAFGARNKHPFVIYNYQNANRPTLFLREKFGAWFHKIHIKHGFFMLRQRLVVPPKDPWLVKKLDKILETGNEDAIYRFFKHHPYLMREFKNMRDMPPKLRAKYELLRQKAQAEFYKEKNATDLLDEAREKMATEFARQIQEGKILASNLDTLLLEKGIRTQSERRKIKDLISGLLTHQAILTTVEAEKKSED